MRLLLIAVLCAIMQAPSPVPRKAADNDAGSRRDIKTNTKTDKKPATPTPSEKVPSPPASKSESENIKRANEQHSIRISELPSVPVKRDWIDCAYLILTGLLVLVTALTFGAIYWQARETARAAVATETAANAARDSAKALINSERAYIDGKIIKSVIIGITRFSLNITNHGRTPAQIFSYETRHGLLAKGNGFSVENLSTQIISNDYFFLASGDTETLLKEFNMDELFAGAEGTETGALCVTIKYGDVVSGEREQRKEHETSFVYYYDVLSSSLTRQSAYNKYT